MLEKEIVDCANKIKRAIALTGGLGGEKERYYIIIKI